MSRERGPPARPGALPAAAAGAALVPPRVLVARGACVWRARRAWNKVHKRHFELAVVIVIN